MREEGKKVMVARQSTSIKGGVIESVGWVGREGEEILCG